MKESYQELKTEHQLLERKILQKENDCYKHILIELLCLFKTKDIDELGILGLLDLTDDDIQVLGNLGYEFKSEKSTGIEVITCEEHEKRQREKLEEAVKKE